MPDPMETLREKYDFDAPADDYVPAEIDKFDEEDPQDGEQTSESPDSKPAEGETDKAENTDNPAGDANAALDADLVIRAAKFGFESEDLKGFTSEQLTKTLSLLEKNTQPEQKQNEPEPAEETKGATQEQEKADKQDSDQGYSVSLDPEEYESALIDEFKKMDSHYRSVIEKVTQEVSEIRRVIQGQYQETAEQRFDTMIENLGEEFVDTFGNGKSRALDKGSAEYQNRVKLSDAMNAIATGYTNTGKTLPPEEELFESAVRMAFGGKVEKKMSAKLAKRAGQIISKPNVRNDKSADPTARAVQSVAEKLREFSSS